MKSTKVEFWFLKSSIEQFLKDLEKFDNALKEKSFPQEEGLELMSCIIAVKERIEYLEKKYPLAQI